MAERSRTSSPPSALQVNWHTMTQAEVEQALSTQAQGLSAAEAAQRLVDRCIAVSPATHPPCNVANPCEMIQGEIDRVNKKFARVEGVELLK